MSGMRKVFIVAVLLLVGISIGSVTGQDETTIGLSVPTLEQDFYILLVDSARTAAEEAGVELIVPETDALLDAEAELANVQSLVDSDIDVLVMYPLDSTLSLGAVEVAAEANIPVILLDNDVLRAGSELEELTIASVVALDEEVASASVVDYLCEALDGEGTVVNLLGAGVTDEEEAELADIPAVQTIVDYAVGIEVAINANCPDITLIIEPSESYTNADSLTNFTTILDENRPDAIIVADAALAIDVINAVRRARLRGVEIVSLERSDDVLGALESGTLSVVVIPNPEELGSVGVNTAVALAGGEEIETTIAVEEILVDSSSAEQFRGPCPNPPCN